MLDKSKHHCSTCRFKFDLYKHPMNEQHKGSIKEKTGLHACLALAFIDKSDAAVIMESYTSPCDMHEFKNNKNE